MEEVKWPLTTRTWKALSFPLLPENYFRLQGREGWWTSQLAVWFQQQGLLADNTPIHGLILCGMHGQCVGYLLLEVPVISQPHMVWELLSLDMTPEMARVSEDLQVYIASTRLP